jgi:hypothetical protein
MPTTLDANMAAINRLGQRRFPLHRMIAVHEGCQKALAALAYEADYQRQDILRANAHAQADFHAAEIAKLEARVEAIEAEMARLESIPLTA